MQLPAGWRKIARTILTRIRDLALTILIVGGVQLLVSLLLWLILFRSYPLGFSMALSLVGFAGWFLSFSLSLGTRRRAGYRRTGATQPLASALSAPPLAHPLVDQMQTQLDRAGCSFVLFLSSLIPLGLAFILRVQADLRTGKTWSEIFPPMP